MPEVLSLALTGRCNSHCIMCNIWKRASELPDMKDLELSRQEIIDLLSRPLFSDLVELDLTGGEPHLKDDLTDIVIGIARLKDSYLPKLRSIIITSNGFLIQKITSNQSKMLEVLKGTGIDLVNVFSIDGIGELHDKIRGTRGAFELVNNTITKLVEFKKEYSNYYIGIKTTILPHNINSLDNILKFALAKGLFHIISPVFFTKNRFSNIDKRREMMLGPNEYDRIIKFYARNELKSSYFYSKARSSLTAGRRQWGCTALHNYLYVEFDGKVYPCEMISEPIGDLKKQSLEDILNSSNFDRLRNKIGRLESCRKCIEPGAIRYSAYSEGFSYAKFLLSLGTNKYRDSLEREGFFKFFN